MRRSSPAFLRDTYSEIRSALAAISSMVATVDRVAQTGPFGTQIIGPLQTVLAFYDEQVADVLSQAPCRAGRRSGPAGGGRGSRGPSRRNGPGWGGRP